MNNLYDDTLNFDINCYDSHPIFLLQRFAEMRVCKTELVEGSPVVCSFLMNHACRAYMHTMVL